MKKDPIVIHVPHASTLIPEDERGYEADLKTELLKLTDHYCDELFCGSRPSVVFPVNRLVCDPERFRSDEDECMARVGMGAVYTRAHDGAVLRNITPGERERILVKYYDPHHARLTEAVGKAIEDAGRCLIVDGHSFSAEPLPFEADQDPDRPDICIGTDPFHTPPELAAAALDLMRGLGYSVKADRPFSGAITPLAYYRREPRVKSIMIELNRRLYMDAHGRKSGGFEAVRNDVQTLIERLARMI